MSNAQIATNEDNTVWFAYDGQCPLCLMGATHFRIRDAAGNLQLLDAREQPAHPLMQEIKEQRLNLDEGMVIKFKNTFYQGADALNIMAMLSTNNGWFNRINALLFRSRFLSKLLYPSMRGARNSLIAFKGVQKLDNLGDNHG